MSLLDAVIPPLYGIVTFGLFFAFCQNGRYLCKHVCRNSRTTRTKYVMETVLMTSMFASIFFGARSILVYRGEKCLGQFALAYMVRWLFFTFLVLRSNALYTEGRRYRMSPSFIKGLQILLCFVLIGKVSSDSYAISTFERLDLPKGYCGWYATASAQMLAGLLEFVLTIIAAVLYLAPFIALRKIAANATGDAARFKSLRRKNAFLVVTQISYHLVVAVFGMSTRSLHPDYLIVRTFLVFMDVAITNLVLLFTYNDAVTRLIRPTSAASTTGGAHGSNSSHGQSSHAESEEGHVAVQKELTPIHNKGGADVWPPSDLSKPGYSPASSTSSEAPPIMLDFNFPAELPGNRLDVFPGVLVDFDEVAQQGGSPPFQCDICLRNFKSESVFRVHRKRHDSPGHMCKICGKVLLRSHGLRVHMKRHVRSRKCPHCPATFSLGAELNQHVRFIHLGKGYACSVCGQSFSRKSNRTRHMKTHVNRPIKLPNLTPPQGDKTHPYAQLGLAIGSLEIPPLNVGVMQSLMVFSNREEIKASSPTAPKDVAIRIKTEPMAEDPSPMEHVSSAVANTSFSVPMEDADSPVAAAQPAPRLPTEIEMPRLVDLGSSSEDFSSSSSGEDSDSSSDGEFEPWAEEGKDMPIHWKTALASKSYNTRTRVAVHRRPTPTPYTVPNKLLPTGRMLLPELFHWGHLGPPAAAYQVPHI